MQDRKVLVVLDDVDHRDQLEALAGAPHWFKAGSIVIITTRDEQVLVAHGVKLIHNVNLLSNKEAIRLFSRYAFGREIPIQKYGELTQKIVRYVAGLPLTITVLGSSLCGQTELHWIDFLKRLETIPLEETLKKLDLSYICLEEDLKEMFLDVVCILKGKHIHYAIRVLESCGFHVRYGLRVLEQRSLITISGGDSIGMHDHIEEMGKNIVCRSHPHNPNKHSRLWIDDEIKHILTNDLGSEATRCIRFNHGGLDPTIVMKGLRKMKKLRFLNLTLEVEFTTRSSDCLCWNSKSKKVSPYFPNALQYLQCNDYPFRSLPKTFEANNLVTLAMSHSRIEQLWEGSKRKVLHNLKYLNLGQSRLRTLDLGITPSLVELDLFGCPYLVKLHMPVECLELRSLIISRSKLRTLDLGLAPNLEKLKLKECDDLVQLHLPSRCLNLTSLEFTNVKLRNLDLRPTPNLKFLRLKSCYYLEELHMADECQKLESLDISSSKLRTLELGLAPNLKKLELVKCNDLEELQVSGECLDLRSLNLSDLKLRTLDLGFTPNLEELNLNQCDELVEIHMSVKCLELRFINLYDSKLRTLDLELARNLETIILENCRYLEEFHMADEGQKLSSVSIGHSKLRTLDLGLTPNLKYLALISCNDLEELHMADACQNLEYVEIIHSKLRAIDLGLSINLKSLYVNDCWHFEELHEDLGRLECLERLSLSGCRLLRYIPNNICKMKSLKVLDIKGTSISHLPQSVFLLKGLRIYGSRELLQSCGFIQISKDERNGYVEV